MFNSKQYCKALAAGLLLFAAGSAQAIPVTYNFTITGTVNVLGTKTVTVKDKNGNTTSEPTTTPQSNAYGLKAGDIITAFGTFKADLDSSEPVTVYFDATALRDYGNILTIDTNGTNDIQLLASQDATYSSVVTRAPYLTFSNGVLTDFDYLKSTTPKFNSSFLNFDDMTSSSSSVTTGNGNNTRITTTTYESMFGTWNSAVITPIPEADTYAMLLAGLGLVGFMARRRAALIS